MITWLLTGDSTSVVIPVVRSSTWTSVWAIMSDDLLFDELSLLTFIATSLHAAVHAHLDEISGQLSHVLQAAEEVREDAHIDLLVFLDGAHDVFHLTYLLGVVLCQVGRLHIGLGALNDTLEQQNLLLFGRLNFDGWRRHTRLEGGSANLHASDCRLGKWIVRGVGRGLELGRLHLHARVEGRARREARAWSEDSASCVHLDGVHDWILCLAHLEIWLGHTLWRPLEGEWIARSGLVRRLESRWIVVLRHEWHSLTRTTWLISGHGHHWLSLLGWHGHWRLLNLPTHGRWILPLRHGHLSHWHSCHHRVASLRRSQHVAWLLILSA